MRRHIAMVNGKERVMKEIVVSTSRFSSVHFSSAHCISFHMFEEGNNPSASAVNFICLGWVALHRVLIFLGFSFYIRISYLI